MASATHYEYRPAKFGYSRHDGANAVWPLFNLFTEVIVAGIGINY